MNEEIEEFFQQFGEVIKECERFCVAVRAKEYQKEAIKNLDMLKQQIFELKSRAISMNDDDFANCCLSLEYIALAIQHELRMWVAIKEDDASSAWEDLVGAETAAGNAIRAHPVASHLTDYLTRLAKLQNLLFPNIFFISPGIIIYESHCSICGSEYGECNHVKGKPYMGEMCSRGITKAYLQECSIVPNPANKNARITSISDENGIMRDLLSWREISEDD